MPLARILTRNPERTAELSSQLKQQGYSVEVARPDQANLAAADLEIEFEICERADVLDRAADLATELGADVAVASGVLQMAPKAAAEPSVHGSTALQPVALDPVALQPVFSQKAVSQKIMAEPEFETVMQAESHSAEHAQERDPERDFEAAFAPVIEMPAAAQASQEVVDVPVMEHEPLPPVAFMEESPALQPIATPAAESYSAAPVAERHPEVPAVFSELPRAADPMPYLAQLTPFGTPAARTQEKQPPATPVRPPEAPQANIRSRKVLQDGARIAAQSWAGALALAASTKASVRDHFEEYRKRAQVRSAEARAQHAARLLDLEQRRAEAHQRAAELELAREQAAARLMELVREREPGLPPERVREQMPFEPVVPARSEQAQSMYERLHAQGRKREVPPVAVPKQEPDVKPVRAAMTATPWELWRGINPPLRAVLTGAAAVTALFIVGIVLGLFHSSPPLASTATRPSSGVTVQTGAQNAGVTLQAGPAKAQAAQPNAEIQQAKPQPGQSVPSAQAQSAGTVAKPSPRVRQAHLVAEQSETQIGDDVVIRHYSRPVPTQKPKQAGQQAGLKHFSDLEN